MLERERSENFSGNNAVKFLCHIAPIHGREKSLSECLASRIARWREDHPDLQFERFERLPNDPFRSEAPYRATLGIRGNAATPDRLARLLDGFAAEIEDVARAELGTALVGTDIAFREPDPNCAVRLEYLMRRKDDSDHESYLRRYRDVHSRFGLATPGARGYVQFHVDPEASQAVARAAGLGVWDIDSVSELHLGSLDEFLEAITQSSVGAEAIADEKLFVDRAHSFYLCSRNPERPRASTP